MQKAHIIHNPTSGDEDFTREKIISLVKASGFKCGYSSTKEKNCWTIDEGVEFLIVAGGDGTVKKTATELLKGKLKGRKLPIAILPIGSANNIADTLGIKGRPKKIVQSWRNASIADYDIGCTDRKSKNNFFIESAGFGLFPYLMRKMVKIEGERKMSREENLQTALTTLSEIIPTYKAHDCVIQLDGKEMKGKFLLIEIMNTRSIGPNLNLAPFANTEDGLFEVVLIPETQRAKLASFVTKKSKGLIKGNSFQIEQAKTVSINWSGKYAHLDDEGIKSNKDVKLNAEINKAALKFLIPKASN